MDNITEFFYGYKRVMEPWREHMVCKKNQKYWHIKNEGAKVLLVAHVDTVLQTTKPVITTKTVVARGLDDRLGVFMCMSLLEERDDVDVLITDDEEVGMSSAEHVPTKDLEKYNCIIELDRGGSDFVHYGLADDDLIGAYSKYSKVGYGLASDICYLDRPSCGCINVGIGYYLPHAKGSYAVIDEYIAAYSNVSDFISKYKDTHFKPHTKPVYSYDYSQYYKSSFPKSSNKRRKMRDWGIESSYSYKSMDYLNEDEWSNYYDELEMKEVQRNAQKEYIENMGNEIATTSLNCEICGLGLIFESELEDCLCTRCAEKLFGKVT
jgi:hypothetical protein